MSSQLNLGKHMDIRARIREVLRMESEAISALEVTPAFETAVHALLACKGKIVTTGIGKAGHIAQKCAATFCSTGAPACFLHPAEAGHGDLGLLDRADLVLAFSTSGKSVEVLEMLQLAQHLGISTIIGVTSHPDSQLRELSTIVLDMGKIEEACPLGLTPSVSIAVMLAIADALAIALMELRGFSRQDFGLRHHGGYLGRKARLDNE